MDAERAQSVTIKWPKKNVLSPDFVAACAARSAAAAASEVFLGLKNLVSKVETEDGKTKYHGKHPTALTKSRTS